MDIDRNGPSTAPEPPYEIFIDYDQGSPGDAPASNNGHGTVEILDVFNLLLQAGIPSCAVGIQPLEYYGSDRLSHPWPYNPPHPGSIHHTLPRFHLRAVKLVFNLAPSEDHLIACDQVHFERSRMGIPYPKLKVFAQSLLDTRRWADLEELVDGMDLTEEWGEENLKLDGFVDVEYADRKNQKILASIPKTPSSSLMEISVGPVGRREVYLRLVRNKQLRIGAEMPGSLYNTKYRAKGSADPRLEDRKHV